jgi:hypothetical protein
LEILEIKYWITISLLEHLKKIRKKKSFFRLGITRVKKERGDGGIVGVKGIKLTQGLVMACFENGNEQKGIS